MRDRYNFIVKQRERNITEWIVNTCPGCGQQHGYEFQKGQVYLNNSCECISFYEGPQLRSWDHIARLYNKQTNPEIINKMDIFWGFKKPDYDKDKKE